MARPRSRWILAAVGLLLALGAAFSWMQRPLTVDAVQVRMAPLVRSLQFSARVVAPSRVDIGSTLTGRVDMVRVAEGDRVRQDAVLVELESQEQRAALAQAEAARQQAVARLAGLRSTGRSAAQAGVSQAQAALDAAQSEFARVQKLVAQEFLSASRLDEARRARDVALAQLAGAQSQVRALGDQGVEIVQAQAQLALAVSASDGARARLAQTLLRAPAPARVLSRQVEPGQIVQPGRALLTLALDGPTQLSAQVDERFLDQLARDQPATAVADAYPGRRFAARVLSIAPAVDPQRGAIEVKFALPDAAPDFLRQDMTLSVEVETARRDKALVVPAAALTPAADAGSATLRLVRDGRIEERAVRLGLRTLDAAEVVQGLADGDLVVIDRLARTGARVTVRLLAADAVVPARGSGGGGGGAAALTNMMGRP